MKRAAALRAVAHFVGSDHFTNALLGLTPQALCCRAAPQAQSEPFKTHSKEYQFITEEFAETLDEFRPVNGVAVQSHFLNNGDHLPPTFNAPEKLGIKR